MKLDKSTVDKTVFKMNSILALNEEVNKLEKQINKHSKVEAYIEILKTCFKRDLEALRLKEQALTLLNKEEFKKAYYSWVVTECFTGDMYNRTAYKCLEALAFILDKNLQTDYIASKKALELRERDLLVIVNEGGKNND